MQVKITAPCDFSSEKIREMLLAASNCGMDRFARTEFSKEIRVNQRNLVLPAEVGRFLMRAAKDCGASKEEVASWILAGASTKPIEAEPALPSLVTESGNAREGLTRAFLQGARPFLDGKIVIAEASTGVGKTACALRLASECRKRHPHSLILIAVPTIAVLAHYVSQVHRFGSEIELPVDSVGLVLGKQEFLSESLTREYAKGVVLGDNADLAREAAQVLTWLDSGGKPSLSCRFWGMGSDVCYLTEEAYRMAPSLDFGRCTLPFLSHTKKQTSTKRDRGEESYEECIEESGFLSGEEDEFDGGGRVVLLTHTMVATRFRNSMLSESKGDSHDRPPTYMIVDEAHDFETNAARIFGGDLSLSQFARLLKSCSREDLANRVSGMATQIKSQVRTSRESVPSEIFQSLSTMASDLIPEVRKLLSKRIDSDVKSDIKDALSTLHALKVGSYVSISFSPVRREVSIIRGPRSVTRFLQLLWEWLSGAVLMSGTIWIPDEDGRPSIAYFRMKQALDDGSADKPNPSSLRLHVPPPIVAPWLYQKACLMVPSEEDLESLSFPRYDYSVENDSLSWERNDAAVAQWQEQVAQVVAKTIASKSTGGVLVLCASYEDVEKVGSHARAVLADRVIQRGELGSDILTFRAQCERFLELCSTGLRPVWFATGAAWTGLDLVVHSPMGDRFPLSDLVILRAPFGNNRNSTQIWRTKKKRSTVWQEAVVTVRQGMGRLVRSPDQPVCNLWWMDGRTWKKTKGRPATPHRYLLALLEPFGRKKTFRAPLVRKR